MTLDDHEEPQYMTSTGPSGTNMQAPPINNNNNNNMYNNNNQHHHTNNYRRSFLEMAGAMGNSTRRGSLLGGRKSDLSAISVANTTNNPHHTMMMMNMNMTMGTGGGGGGGTTPSHLNTMNSNVGRRESLTFDEIWRRESLVGGAGSNMRSRTSDFRSMDMSDMMESFKGMSTTGELNSSSDTIGTIDGLPSSGMSMSHMSGLSNMSGVMMMSNDSISLFAHDATAATTTMVKRPSAASHDGGIHHTDSLKNGSLSSASTNSGGLSGMGSGGNGMRRISDSNWNSINPMLPPDSSIAMTSDMWNSKQFQSLMHGPLEGSGTAMFDSSYRNKNPPQVFDINQTMTTTSPSSYEAQVLPETRREETILEDD
jgi:hypothetical protein